MTLVIELTINELATVIGALLYMRDESDWSEDATTNELITRLQPLLPDPDV